MNVADFLSRWSNGAFASPIHRVRRPPADRASSARLSVAYFSGGVVHEVDGHLACEPLLAPGEAPRFAPISLGAYLERNYDRTLNAER